VKGSLFVDYTRMIRYRPGVEWSRHLGEQDLELVSQTIDLDAWYPMEVFERLGLAILAEVAGGDIRMARMWGRLSVDTPGELPDLLLVPGNPRETLMRCTVYRSAFFDFEAISMPLLIDGKAHVTVDYGMGALAEEAAAHQTMGVFERLLEVSGGRTVRAEFLSRRWAGDPTTSIQLEWRTS
jgi:hypothetical protein